MKITIDIHPDVSVFAVATALANIDVTCKYARGQLALVPINASSQPERHGNATVFHMPRHSRSRHTGPETA